MPSSPLAVLISDIHYNINTLPLADAALRRAIIKANELAVPLIVAGDLHDTKANMRAECMNAMLNTFQMANIQPFVLIGNHDKVNEKSHDNSLNFLNEHCILIDLYTYDSDTNLHLFPYYSGKEELRRRLSSIPTGEILIMHQGITDSISGEYIVDHSAITKNDVSGFRVISGHYHRRQTITLPNGGQWDYIGNPYTLNFGETNDPEKGYQILMHDGSLEFVPTNLRKHIIIEHDIKTQATTWSSGPAYQGGGRDDLILARVKGTKEELSLFDVEEWRKDQGIGRYARLDLIQVGDDSRYDHTNNSLTQSELLDSIIDARTDLSDTKKQELKTIWKDL